MDLHLSWAWGANSSAVSITDNVSLHHAIGLQVLAGLLRSSHFIVVATVEVSANTALSSTVSGAQSDGCVVSGVTDENAQGLREDEYVVLIVLVDLEDLGVTVWVDNLVSKINLLSVKGGVVHVVNFNLVFAHEDGDSNLVIGNFVSQNKVARVLGTVTTEECWALRHVSVVGKVVISLNGTRSNITVAVDSILHSGSVQWGESGEDWSLQWSGKEAKVDSVEVFIFPLRAVEVDISF